MLIASHLQPQRIVSWKGSQAIDLGCVSVGHQQGVSWPSGSPASCTSYCTFTPLAVRKILKPAPQVEEGGEPPRWSVLCAKVLTPSDANSGRIILPRVSVEANLSFVIGYRCASAAAP